MARWDAQQAEWEACAKQLATTIGKSAEDVALAQGDVYACEVFEYLLTGLTFRLGQDGPALLLTNFLCQLMTCKYMRAINRVCLHMQSHM